MKSNSSARYLPKENENIWPQKRLQEFHSNSICDSPEWRQPKSSSAGEWMNKLWYINTVGYYSAKKTEQIVDFGQQHKFLKRVGTKENMII